MKEQWSGWDSRAPSSRQQCYRLALTSPRPTDRTYRCIASGSGPARRFPAPGPARKAGIPRCNTCHRGRDNQKRYFVVLRSKTQRASRPANYFSAQLIPPGRFNIQQRRTTMTSIWNISRDSFCILIGCFFSFKTFESWSFPVENNHKQNIYQIILMECLLAAVAPVHHVPISGTVRHNFTTKRRCFW
jgi:hypothetical protein